MNRSADPRDHELQWPAAVSKRDFALVQIERIRREQSHLPERRLDHRTAATIRKLRGAA